MQLPALGMYREKIRNIEDRLDRLTVKLEPRLESKVEENIKRWKREEKKKRYL